MDVRGQNIVAIELGGAGSDSNERLGVVVCKERSVVLGVERWC